MVSPGTESALELCRTRKAAVVSAWASLALHAYPVDGFRFLATEPDPFRNPVGYTFRVHMSALFDELAGDMNPENIVAHLHAILRVRAVQAIAAPDVLAFVPALKDVVRSTLRDVSDESLGELYERIERLCLIADEQFAVCRSYLSEIRGHEQARRTWVQQRMRERKVRSGVPAG